MTTQIKYIKNGESIVSEINSNIITRGKTYLVNWIFNDGVHIVNDNGDNTFFTYEELKQNFYFDDYDIILPHFHEDNLFKCKKCAENKPTINENKRIALELAIKNKGENQSLTMEILFKEADEILEYLTK